MEHLATRRLLVNLTEQLETDGGAERTVKTTGGEVVGISEYR